MIAEPLGSLVAGVPAWPVALAVAMIGYAGGQIRSRRRRRSLNERLHELRRPLQTLALSNGHAAGPVPDGLELALAALRDLDREVNGGAREFRRRPVSARQLAEAAVERWSPRASASGRRIGVRWTCEGARVHVDPIRIAQALDNLIANALEHGSGEITIEGARRGRYFDLVVRDNGSVPCRLPGRADPRRGHGLRVTRSMVRDSGAALRPPGRVRGGTVAALVLPLLEDAPGEPEFDSWVLRR